MCAAARHFTTALVVPCAASLVAGALFFHLREQLAEFAGRLAGMDLELRLTAQLAQDLARRLKEEVGG